MRTEVNLKLLSVLYKIIDLKKVVCHVAILGKFTLPPGIYKVLGNGEFWVSYKITDRIIDEARKIDFDISDCTVFAVEHINKTIEVYTNNSEVNDILDDSLEAVNKHIIWSKTHDVVGKLSTQFSKIGRADVKFFFIDGPKGSRVVWQNPMFWTDKSGFSLISGFLSNMRVLNGPAENPTPPLVERIMNSLDLVNLGFFTEAFITTFSLLDDLTQNVLKVGLSKKGLSAKQQMEVLRSIESERLKIYLTYILKLCDWDSLEDSNLELYKELLKTNELRNKIMHGGALVGRKECVEAMDIMIQVVDWLRQNPFGYTIEQFPLLQLIEPSYTGFGDN